MREALIALGVLLTLILVGLLIVQYKLWRFRRQLRELTRSFEEFSRAVEQASVSLNAVAQEFAQQAREAAEHKEVFVKALRDEIRKLEPTGETYVDGKVEIAPVRAELYRPVDGKDE